jgi:hypothetical protein
MFFQNPPYWASRQLLIPRIAAVGTSFNTLPCKAWHGYMVTNAHRVEVEVGADGHASAPLSGAAAAAGAWFYVAPCPTSISLVAPVFFRRIPELKNSPSQKLRKLLHRLHLQSAQLGSTTTSIMGLLESKIPNTLLSVLDD